MLTLLLAAALAAPLSPTLEARLAKRTAELETALSAHGETEGLGERLRAEVVANLDAKPAGLALTEDELARTVVDFEAFRLRATVTSGVTPKRYFGYFDERWDTARWETRLRETTRQTAAVLAEECTRRGHGWTVSEAEIAVTWVAEGGALWLGEESHRLEGGFHPVMDVGLDDIASGLRDEPALVAALDAAAGTDLAGLVAWVDDPAAAPPVPALAHGVWLAGRDAEGRMPVLTRAMSFDESVVATALMVLWEKEIAAEQAAVHGVDLASLDPDRQWIAMSLVYNSGIVHKPLRWRLIRDLTAAEWLHGAVQANAKRRWAIDIVPPADRLASLRAGEAYPSQPTAWLAGYHILQRYGAYVALRDLGQVFDAEGRFVPRHQPGDALGPGLAP
ncbi:MAG: hypothetical protein EP330_02375 [Deltaproteobacteria bacterium]|nr:MAG: hypothetical protein EP330_02375 [Deltaproteobacteria bacterium]